MSMKGGALCLLSEMEGNNGYIGIVRRGVVVFLTIVERTGR